MKLGFNLAHIKSDNYGADAYLFGNLTFSNRFTGHPYADFLLGIPTTAAAFFSASTSSTGNGYQYDFFFTDDFKVNSQLTVNYGVRYELHPGWQENNGSLAMFDIGTGSIVVQDGSLNKVSALFPTNYVPIVEASSLGLPGKTILKTDRNNFAPRLGLAYRPGVSIPYFAPASVIYFDVVPRELTMGGVPFVLNEQPFNNPLDNPSVVSANGVSERRSRRSLFGLASSGRESQSRDAIQHAVQLHDRAFAMEHGIPGLLHRHQHAAGRLRLQLQLARTVTVSSFINKPRPFPQYPAINYFTNGAGHQFHSFTAEVERRMARGLQFQSSWVWARDIGDLERGQALENPFDRQREVQRLAGHSDAPFHDELHLRASLGKGPAVSSAALTGASMRSSAGGTLAQSTATTRDSF